MPESPLVSVIIPTHNRPDFLKKTIISILRQTYSNIEVIVVSNGFNKNNKIVVEEIKDPRLFYFDQENSGGPSSPRNHGIRKATGKYLAFCDDDDLWMPEKIEKQVAALEANFEYGLCYSKMLRFDENHEWAVSHEEGSATLKTLLYVNTIPISSVLIKKTLVDKYGGFSEAKIIGASEDYEFLLRHAITTKYYFLNEYLIKYWTGKNRTSSVDSERTIKDWFNYLCRILGCFSLLKKNTKMSSLKFIKPTLFHIYIFCIAIRDIFIAKLILSYRKLRML